METAPVTPEPDRLAKAQRTIAMAIGAALPLWYLPFASPLACNAAEMKMVEAVLAALERPESTREVNDLFMFFRRKYLLLNVATFVPWLGPAFQIFEVYALGQFVLAAASLPEAKLEDEHLSAAWAKVEGELWSGDRMVRFYEEFSGGRFPEVIKPGFTRAIDLVGRLIGGMDRMPVVEWAQETARQTKERGKSVLRSLRFW